MTSPRGASSLVHLGKLAIPRSIKHGQEKEVLERPSLGPVSTLEPMTVTQGQNWEESGRPDGCQVDLEKFSHKKKGCVSRQ